MRSRALIVAVATAALTLGVAGVASGLIVVYDNNFRSGSEFREIKRAKGGKPCQTKHEGNTRLAALVTKGPKDCIFTTPVEGDTSGPNHQIEVKAKLNKATASKIRKRVYVGVALRTTKKVGYELRVFPQRQRWVLHRAPEAADFPITGDLDKIRKVGKDNELQLRVFGERIHAWINGERVVKGVADPDTAQVSGRKTAVVIGSTRDTKKRAKATFDKLKVKIPNP